MLDILKSLDDEDILGLTLIGECRGEPIEGIVAVGSVIRNRVQLKVRGSNYTSVCLAKEQFSCWNDDSPELKLLASLASSLVKNTEIADIFLRQCLFIASGITRWYLRDNTKGSTHYLTASLYNSDKCPGWAKSGRSKITIGSQVFMIA